MKKQHWTISAIVTALAAAGIVGFATVDNPPPPTPQPVIVGGNGISVTPTPPTVQAKVGVAYLYPDSAKTPGMANADITQENVDQNICNPNWSTKSIRPPVGYTNNIKVSEINAGYTYQGDTNLADYELDHFISLEIGGDPKSVQNLWPEPYHTKVNGIEMGAHQKDKVENLLHKEICDNTITLQEAQDIITTDWYSCYLASSAGAQEACK